MLATLNIKVKYRMLPGGAMNILCENVDHHRQVMEILRTKNNGGHSYTPKEDRKTLLVMKDIHFSVDIEDIAADIEEQTGLKPTLKRMETVKSKEGGHTKLRCGNNRGSKSQRTNKG